MGYILKGNGIRSVTLPDRQVILSVWVVILFFFWPLRAFFGAIALAIGLSIMAKIITVLGMDWLTEWFIGGFRLTCGG
jgi:hypothetical protein